MPEVRSDDLSNCILTKPSHPRIDGILSVPVDLRRLLSPICPSECPTVPLRFVSSQGPGLGRLRRPMVSAVFARRDRPVRFAIAVPVLPAGWTAI